MFRFAQPHYLYFLYLIPVITILFFLYFRKKKKYLLQFAEKDLHEVLFGEKSFLKEIFKFVLFIAALSLLILAIARPQLGSRIEEVKQIGIEIYICLDVSMSMKAEDLKPNRLDQAKNEISSLIKNLQGDKIGLIIFAGDAFIQFPLTTDYSAANLFLSAVDVGSVPQPGTAIANSINLAIKSFDYKSPAKKVIILITDGEDHEGDIDAAIKNANDNNVLLFAIGMGSPNGSPIPIYDNRGNQVDFKRDNKGNIVLTKLDEITLRKISQEGRGKYYVASGYRNELEVIFKDLSNIEKSEFGSKRISDYEDKYYYFLFPALLLLTIEFFVSEKKSHFLTKIMNSYKLKKQI